MYVFEIVRILSCIDLDYKLLKNHTILFLITEAYQIN